MADVRRCVKGHPAAERDTVCGMCGAELEPLAAPARDQDGEVTPFGSAVRPAPGTTGVTSAPAVTGASGWPNIGIGLVILLVSGLAVTFTVPLGFPAVTVLLAAVGLLGLANLIIGSVAEGIRVATRPR